MQTGMETVAKGPVVPNK